MIRNPGIYDNSNNNGINNNLFNLQYDIFNNNSSRNLIVNGYR